MKLFRRREPAIFSLSSDGCKLALIKEYLSNSLALFQRDPPDTDFQRGYLEATKEFNRYVIEDIG